MHSRPSAPLALATALVLAGCQTDIGRDSADEHDRTALMYAAERGDLAEMRRLIDDGARVDQTVRGHPAARELIAFLMWMQQLPERDPGYSALHYAIEGRHLDAAELLLESGANAAGDGTALSPLQLVMLTGQAQEGVPLLLAHGAVVRATPDAPDPGPLVATAVMNRDEPTLRLLLKRGADPNAANPLATAAERGDSLFVEILLQAGADPGLTRPNTGWTPAMLARARGHLAIAERLGGGAGTPQQLSVDLTDAVLGRDTAAVRALLEQGADPGTITRTGDPLIAEAVRTGEVALVELLLAAGASPDVEQYGVPLINLAAQTAEPRIVAALLRHGANGRTAGAPTYAAGAGAVEVLQLLAVAGANLREHRDEPLRAAAFGGHGDAVRYLLAMGADPDAEDEHGMRPLRRAAAVGGPDVARALLEAGADPDAGEEGWTPLMGAAMSGDTVMMALLLDFGADPGRRDEEGKDAADRARAAGNPWVADWLAARARGAARR